MNLYFLFLNYCIGITAALFTSRPVSQNVYLGQRVKFECSTSLSGYSLSIPISEINETKAQYRESQTPLPSGGIKVTTSFIVTREANATTAICLGISPNGSVFRTPRVAVYAQGAPEKVCNVGVMALCPGSVFIFWDPVFTLKNLSVQYLITVNNQSLDPISTFYAYYELTDAQEGETKLSITVMASNKVGNGANTVLQDKYSVTNLQLSYDQRATIRGTTRWTAHFNSKFSTIKNTMKDAIVENYTKVHSCSKTNACLNSTNVTINNDQVTWSNNLWLREKYLNYLVVQCSNSKKSESNQVELSTHDVQSINDVTFQNGIFCLNFSLINGWKLNAIHLHFEAPKKLICVNVLVMIPSHETILYSCSNDTKNWNFITGNLESLTPGNWTVKACDEPGLDYRCTNPADERSIKIMDATQTAASVGHATLTQLHLILSGLLIVFIVLL